MGSGKSTRALITNSLLIRAALQSHWTMPALSFRLHPDQYLAFTCQFLRSTSLECISVRHRVLGSSSAWKRVILQKYTYASTKLVIFFHQFLQLSAYMLTLVPSAYIWFPFLKEYISVPCLWIFWHFYSCLISTASFQFPSYHLFFLASLCVPSISFVAVFIVVLISAHWLPMRTLSSLF